MAPGGVSAAILLELLIFAAVVWLFLDARRSRRELYSKIASLQEDQRSHERECSRRRQEEAEWMGRMDATIDAMKNMAEKGNP